MSRCIFCFRSNPSVTFSREHIIPHSLGGKLILRDYVCTHCNSNLGSDCDHEILNNPEMLTAIEKLKLPHDRAKLINHNFKIRGLAVDGVELKGKATKDGFVFHPQSLPDGSRIHPEMNYKKPLLKSLLRDQRLYDAGLTNKQIREEWIKLTEAYDQERPGGNIEWPTLGITLVKKSDIFRINLEPRKPGDISRLIAKIAYEFGFAIGYIDFLMSERVAEPLHCFITTGKEQPGFHIFRTGTELSDYAPFHFISFQVYDSITRVVVVFFGNIAYTFITPTFEDNILRQIAETYECPDAFGVEYQQNLAENTVGFWALLPDRKVKLLI